MKITAYTTSDNSQSHEITDIINSGNAINPDSYYLIGIYVSNAGGPIFAVNADNEYDAIEELAASQYGHFILIDNEDDLAEYDRLEVMHHTDAGPCYIDEPIAYMAKVDHFDEQTAARIALENLPDRIMVNINVDEEFDVITITPDDKQERKWISQANLTYHTNQAEIAGADEIRKFVESYDRSCYEDNEGMISVWGGFYNMDTKFFLELLSK